jgi:hypothetical protein
MSSPCISKNLKQGADGAEALSGLRPLPRSLNAAPRSLFGSFSGNPAPLGATSQELRQGDTKQTVG